jgi:putative spermidine/putrescine transport system permease protein
MLWVVLFLVLLFLIFPVLIIIPMSFSSSQYLQFPPPGFSLQWYEKFFISAQWTGSLMTSLQVGFITTVLALTLGVLTAMGIYKSHFKGKAVVLELFMMPMLVPAIIVGLAIYRYEVTVNVSGTVTGLVLAHTVLAIPFVIRTMLASLSGLNPNFELAALSLGANRFQTAMKVTFPIMKRAIFSSAMFAFATSFDEIVVTQFVSGVRVATLPKLMWDGLRQQLDPTITAIAAIMVTGITLFMVALNGKDIFAKKVLVEQDEMESDF